jgi:hypothetical protein
MLLEMDDEGGIRDLHPLCITDWVAHPGMWSADGQEVFFAAERKVADAELSPDEIGVSHLANVGGHLDARGLLIPEYESGPPVRRRDGVS